MLFAYWLPSVSAAHRRVPDEVLSDIDREESVLMAGSQSEAVVAPCTAGRRPGGNRPMVRSVTTSGPSNNILVPGDLIQAVDEATTTTVADVQGVAAHHVGEAVLFTVLRDNEGASSSR